MTLACLINQQIHCDDNKRVFGNKKERQQRHVILSMVFQNVDSVDGCVMKMRKEFIPKERQMTYIR